ncbi:MAG: pyridoxal phosphate-dependent aminotransferase [Clostridiales bacterium]|nr:pyridoxal phosphate-dependent aminotransferase [Clostridiales bacterium]
MKYVFDSQIDRKNTYCLKYDYAVENGKSADALPLWIADMDFGTAPEVVEALKKRAEHGVFGYTMPKKDYFQTVADWFKNRHGWNADPEKFICVPGVVFGICSLIRAVTEVGDGVLICQPVYYPFSTAVTRNKRKLVVSELKNQNGRYSVDFEDFEKKIIENKVKAFILCSPHNPVGRVWTREELEKMGDICLKHGVFVISDEIHADFTYEGHKHIMFPTVKKEFEKTCAVCTAPTKTFNLAGLQISNIYIPDPQVRKKFEDDLDIIAYWEPNIFGVTACHTAYTKGGEWLNQLKKYLAENLGFVRSYLKDNLPEIKLVEPEGTYLVWLDCRSLGLSDEELQTLVEQKAKLWLDDGYMFGAGGSGFERINIACPRATLKVALDKLKSAIKS